MAYAAQSSLRSWWSPACRGPWVTISLYGSGRVTVRPAITDAVKALNRVLASYKYATRYADTGAYNCRRVTGGSTYSLHAYGIALDINWQSNPYSRTLRTDMFRYGDGRMPYRVEAIRTNNGKQVWRWGGWFSGSKDAMHYEITCSPSDIRTGINWSTVYGGSAPVSASMPPAHLYTKEFFDMDEATFRRILDERLKVAEDRQNAWIKSKFDQAVVSIKNNIDTVRDSLANLIRSIH